MDNEPHIAGIYAYEIHKIFYEVLRELKQHSTRLGVSFTRNVNGIAMNKPSKQSLSMCTSEGRCERYSSTRALPLETSREVGVEAELLLMNANSSEKKENLEAFFRVNRVERSIFRICNELIEVSHFFPLNTFSRYSTWRLHYSFITLTHENPINILAHRPTAEAEPNCQN